MGAQKNHYDGVHWDIKCWKHDKSGGDDKKLNCICNK